MQREAAAPGRQQRIYRYALRVALQPRPAHLHREVRELRRGGRATGQLLQHLARHRRRQRHCHRPLDGVRVGETRGLVLRQVHQPDDHLQRLRLTPPESPRSSAGRCCDSPRRVATRRSAPSASVASSPAPASPPRGCACRSARSPSSPAPPSRDTPRSGPACRRWRCTACSGSPDSWRCSPAALSSVPSSVATSVAGGARGVQVREHVVGKLREELHRLETAGLRAAAGEATERLQVLRVLARRVEREAETQETHRGQTIVLNGRGVRQTGLQQRRSALRRLLREGEDHAQTVAEHGGVASRETPLDQRVHLRAVQVAVAEDAEQLRETGLHLALGWRQGSKLTVPLCASEA